MRGRSGSHRNAERSAPTGRNIRKFLSMAMPKTEIESSGDGNSDTGFIRITTAGDHSPQSGRSSGDRDQNDPLLEIAKHSKSCLHDAYFVERQTVPERRLLQRDHYRANGDSNEHVHGHVRPRRFPGWIRQERSSRTTPREHSNRPRQQILYRPTERTVPRLESARKLKRRSGATWAQQAKMLRHRPRRIVGRVIRTSSDISTYWDQPRRIRRSVVSWRAGFAQIDKHARFPFGRGLSRSRHFVAASGLAHPQDLDCCAERG